MIYVTHDQVEAMTMADKVVVLNAGRIEQVGSPMDLYERTATPFVAGFIASPQMNHYEGEVARDIGCAVYGIRTEHVELTGTDGLWTGHVRHVEPLGTLVARVEGSRRFEAGQKIKASPDRSREFRD